MNDLQLESLYEGLCSAPANTTLLRLWGQVRLQDIYLPSRSKQRRPGGTRLRPPPVTPIIHEEWRSEASLTEDVESVGGSLMWRESSSVSHQQRQQPIRSRMGLCLWSVSVLIINGTFPLWSSMFSTRVGKANNKDTPNSRDMSATRAS